MSKKPNILLCISDDQSWEHTGIAGHRTIATPVFDRLASEGLLFTNCFCPAPQCSPSRAALLTGKNIWEIEEAGTHASLFPAELVSYPEILEHAGYRTGYTGKPWGPGNWRITGRTQNPAGKEYNRYMLTPPTRCISNKDYARNFSSFLEECDEDQPFCFWFGAHEPHRPYAAGSGIASGKSLADCRVPGFLPDAEIVRQDLLDYEFEIEWFDRQIGRFIEILKEKDRLNNTIIVVTSDNGMPFPRAKANLYEYSTHVPLAVWWPKIKHPSKKINDLVSLIDLAPTFLEAAGLKAENMSGRSLVNLFEAEKEGLVDSRRQCVYTGKERHNHARYDNVGYPCRAIRTPDYLYIYNFKPDRWPLGDPPGYYCHTKMNCPSKEYILAHQQDEYITPFFEHTYSRRPEEELYTIKADPACMHNLAHDPSMAPIKDELSHLLFSKLRDQKDPRVLGYGDIFEAYPHFGARQPGIGGFCEKGAYNEEIWNSVVVQGGLPFCKKDRG